MRMNPIPTGIRIKQQSRSKRTLIGRVESKTGDTVPTAGRGRKEKTADAGTKRGPVPSVQTARYFYGSTYLLDEIDARTGYRRPESMFS